MLHQQLLHRRALATAGGGRARTLAPCSRPAAAALALSASAAAAAAPAAAPASPASPALRRPRPLVAAAAAAAKGFGANQGKAPPGDGCPCGSGLLYKACCKPHHQLRAPPPPTVEATVRARFSAVVKKEMPFLLRTFHPSFHCVMYNTEPGGAAEKLEDDMWRTCNDFENTNFRVMSVKEDADKPGEWFAEVQYTTANKRAREIDGNGNLRRLVRMERDRFVQGEGGFWQLCDYQLADVPESLAKAALKGKDLPALEKAPAAPAEGAAAEGAAAPTLTAAA